MLFNIFTYLLTTFSSFRLSDARIINLTTEIIPKKRSEILHHKLNGKIPV